MQLSVHRRVYSLPGGCCSYYSWLLMAVPSWGRSIELVTDHLHLYSDLDVYICQAAQRASETRNESDEIPVLHLSAPGNFFCA